MARIVATRALWSALVGTSLVFGALPARADDTAAEIAALKAQLRRLEEKVSAQSRENQQTRAVVRQVAAKGAVSGPAIYTKGPPAIPVLASTCPADKFCYKGLTITPGGFFALESVYRDRFIGADIGTPYGNLPFNNSRTARGDEFRFSARQSRLSLLVEGDVDPVTKLSGYGEFDFLGAAQTANSNESNSYNPRIRHLYAQYERSDLGLHVLAGQTWSFATMFTTGLQTRKENIPLTIDAQYVPGFVWTRQPQIRIVKDINPDVHVGLSLENPQTTEAGTLPGNFTYNSAPVGGGLFNSGNNLSINSVPDTIGKVAWDPHFGDRTIHIEAYGVGRDFYGRFNGHNQDVFTGFGGGSILVPVLPKVLDVQFSGAIGEGIGRYATSQLPDITVSNTGVINPLPEFALLAGATLHATPSIDIYAYAGEEQVDRKAFAGGFGDGNLAANNTGCQIEGGTCSNNVNNLNVKRVRQATIGAWDTFYNGRFGQLRGGVQYSFTEKTLFSTVTSPQQSADENIVLTSLRYYPF